MTIYKIQVGPLQTNCYVVVEAGEAIIIDPGDDTEVIINTIEKKQLKPKHILLTHAHFDHTGALEVVEKKYGLKYTKTKEGDEFKVGDTILTTIETPGHSKDSVCFVVEKESIIFSGDTLFYRSIGRTDLEGGDYQKIQESLNCLMSYPGHFKVYPGHGPETTVDEEKKENPYID